MKGFKKILIIAGPNGAGKTTFATEFLPNEADCPIFINADLIAAKLNPSQPDLAAIQAGRLMLKMIHEWVVYDSLGGKPVLIEQRVNHDHAETTRFKPR